ncbi:Transcriptional regulator of ribosomal bioproteinsis proteins [Saitoella coloradoensis]
MPAPITMQRKESFSWDSSRFGTSWKEEVARWEDDVASFTTPYSDFDTATSASYLPKLEATFCRDFSCCGKTLSDLHDLLQHYEEQHVRFEDDITATPQVTLAQTAGIPDEAATSRARGERAPDVRMLKRRAMLRLDDMYNTSASQPPSSASSETASNVDDYDDIAFDTSILSAPRPAKRPYMKSPSTPGVEDVFLPFSAISTAATSPASSAPHTPVMGHIQPMLGFDDAYLSGKKNAVRTMIPPRSPPPMVIDHPGSTLVVDKPYKCKVPGCDKAYKNQNGLKYHKLHGHCNSNNPLQTSPPPVNTNAASVLGEGGLPALPASLTTHIAVEKPYRCELCCKRYKNLNGLKYHRAHSHLGVAAPGATGAGVAVGQMPTMAGGLGAGVGVVSIFGNGTAPVM